MSTWLFALLTRPGGGHSFSGGGGGGFSGGGYSGGGHYYGGGGGAIGGDMIAPIIALVLIVLVVRIAMAYRSKAEFDTELAPMEPEPPPRLSLDRLYEVDPDFSLAVFEDFAYQLYAGAQRARANLGALAPYVSPVAAGQLAGRSGTLTQVVVGALSLEGITTEDGRVTIGVRIVSNLISGTRSSLLAVEHWSFVRDAGIKTKPPERTRTWPCPNCGAPWSPKEDARTCAHCGQAITPGKLDWAVAQIWIESETPIGPTLTGTVEEQGNDLPTVQDPDCSDELASLTKDDPAVTWDSFAPRVRMIYERLNEGWSAQDLTPVRGLTTAAMHDYLRYWITAYKEQALRNQVSDAAVTGLELAKVVRDHYFDAITVRLFATGHDFTVDAKDHVVGGSRQTLRPYTEYWTFLRASTRRGPVTATPTCPNCGAPLAISDVGDCTHCGVAVENGSFDWVLSKIEQDDVYRG